MKKRLYDLECPYCHEKMVPSRIEGIDDGVPFWHFGWTCGCSEEIRDKNKKEGRL